MLEKEATSSNPKILLVVDDLFFSVKIGSLLMKGGYSCQVTPSEPDALRILQDSRPSLVIVDLDIQRGGVKIIERIRKEKEMIPVVAFSKHHEKVAMERAWKLGCRAVLSRPEFLKTLPSLIEKYQEKER